LYRISLSGSRAIYHTSKIYCVAHESPQFALFFQDYRLYKIQAQISHVKDSSGLSEKIHAQYALVKAIPKREPRNRSECLPNFAPGYPMPHDLCAQSRIRGKDIADEGVVKTLSASEQRSITAIRINLR
jgi:hypothetical protein